MSDSINALYFDNAADVVAGFYALVNDKKFDAAFGCLTDSFRDRVWKNDLNDFEKGYAYTTGIVDVSVGAIPDKQQKDRAEYYAHYTNNTNAPRHPLLDDLPKSFHSIAADARNHVLADALFAMDAKHVDKILQFNHLMIDEMGADKDAVDAIQVKHYFEQNNVETCLWLAKASYAKNDALFTYQVHSTAESRRAICVRDEAKGWQIEGLRYV